MVSDKTGVMEETIATVLSKKKCHPPPLLLYAGNVRRNAYFYSYGYYGGCGQIGYTKISGSLGPSGIDSEALKRWILNLGSTEEMFLSLLKVLLSC